MEDAIFFPLRKNPVICFRLCFESLLGESTLLTLLLLEALHVRAVVEVEAVATVDDDDDDDDPLLFAAISF